MYKGREASTSKQDNRQLCGYTTILFHQNNVIAWVIAKKKVIAWVSTCSLLLGGVDTDDQVVFGITELKRKTTY